MATEESELRKGPWTLEEDRLLIQYIASHGEGRWNLLARSSGLRRTGKSCRLRWLNYLKPDVKRGNLTPEEQIFILELHSKWGNRWSKIAQHLPGRTDNEIKNYWRTRVQKQARQLQVDANSAKFLDAVRCFWTPSLLQQIDSSTTLNDTKDSTPTIASDQAQHASYPPSCNMPNELNMHSNSLSGISTSEDNCSPSISSMDISGFPTSPSPTFDNLLSEMRGCQLDSTYDMEAFKGLDYSVSDCSMSETYWSLADHMGDNLWDMDELRPMIQLQGRGPL